MCFKYLIKSSYFSVNCQLILLFYWLLCFILLLFVLFFISVTAFLCMLRHHTSYIKMRFGSAPVSVKRSRLYVRIIILIFLVSSLYRPLVIIDRMAQTSYDIYRH